MKIDGIEKDILKFLIDYAPLKKWEKDVLSIIRKEAYYFAPQRQTKIMNEGCASYWHSKIMTEKAMKDSELTEYSDHHAGIMSTSGGRLNPYKLGLELFLDIEDRWNKGKFGLEYELCKDVSERERWDKKLGLGRKKIFEVREIYHDLSFIDSFLTEDFCREKKLFTYSHNEKNGEDIIGSIEFEKIKKNLIISLTNSGKPEIILKDANYNNSGELLLEHKNPLTELKRDYAEATLKNLYKIWKRPVHLESKTHEGKDLLFSCHSEDEVEIDELEDLKKGQMVFSNGKARIS